MPVTRFPERASGVAANIGVGRSNSCTCRTAATTKIAASAPSRPVITALSLARIIASVTASRRIVDLVAEYEPIERIVDRIYREQAQ